MKHTPAPHDDFRPGPFGLWALGLAGATRSRWSDEFVAAEANDDATRDNASADVAEEMMPDLEPELVEDRS